MVSSVDISALMKVLPTSSLEPDSVALLSGFIDVPEDQEWRDNIALLEPPAGQRVPYIDPAEALDKLLQSQGTSPEDARAKALGATARMKEVVADKRWVNFFDNLSPDSPECLPVPDFVAWLREENHRATRVASQPMVATQGLKDVPGKEVLAQPDIVEFFEEAAEVAACTPMFRGPDNYDEKEWSLKNLPELPPPKAMIEFMPGPPWDNCEWGDWTVDDNPFLRWREAMRPIALGLEQTLGEPVYHFADLSCDTDDDDVHRFLVLHWCCTWRPDSAFVRYLLKVSGARDVDQLKTALIDPANYTQSFEMNDSFLALEAWGRCRMDYVPQSVRKTVGMVFSSPQSRDVAQSLLIQQIGAHAFIVAPIELATHEWLNEATRYCRSWAAHYVYDGKLDNPIDILADVDVLCVIANETTAGYGFDLKLPNPVEDLLWLAFETGVRAKYYHLDRTQLWNPADCLKKRGVPERVAEQQAWRAAYTRQLKEIRLHNDFGSSGLWNAAGENLGYDLLNLPLPLIRRIAAWQRDYETLDPFRVQSPGELWRARHEQEAFDIARTLQAAVGRNTVVKLYRKQGWRSVVEIDRAGESE